jgi:4-amino-4-deoxy-L-arabinose transferase-like glycosyltransferase
VGRKFQDIIILIAAIFLIFSPMIGYWTATIISIGILIVFAVYKITLLIKEKSKRGE